MMMERRARRATPWAACLVCTLGLATGAAAEDLRRLSLEELMQIEVTSVSKREESLFDATAAVHVITRQDIRRSGATCIPEALRLAPGVEVARLNSSGWAITIRGFNGRFANQLLVLIDGRSVYTPVFAGVFWDVQDLLLEDVDRIEVIRGPGGTLWGANAVNGVINIITRPAAKTVGTYVEAGGGTELRGLAGVRHGQAIGERGAWRIFGRWFDRDDGDDEHGRPQPDSWRAGRGGFRLDLDAGDGASTWTAQGDIYRQRYGQTSFQPQLFPPARLDNTERLTAEGGDLLGRWRRRFSPASELQVQAYFDAANRGLGIAELRQATIDLDLQHHWRPTSAHDVVWGVGWRSVRMEGLRMRSISTPTPVVTNRLYNAFAQDRVRLLPDRLELTLGGKLEHCPYTGHEFQPNARVLWSAAKSHRVWAAVSRAVRMPSRGESDLTIDLNTAVGPGGVPVLGQALPNPDLEAPELVAFEIGWRATFGEALSFDATAYRNRHDKLRSVEMGEPELVAEPVPYILQPYYFRNGTRGTVSGFELSGRWRPRERWTLGGSYSYLDMELEQDAGVVDPASLQDAGRSPRHQARLFSQWDLSAAIELDACGRYVAELPADGVASYIDGDLRLAWRTPWGLRLTVVGQNLLHERRREYAPLVGDFIATTLAQRGGYATLDWRF